MSELNPNATTTPTKIADYSAGTLSPEIASTDNFFYYNPDFTKWFKHYVTHAKIKKSIDAYATWVLGQGWYAQNSRDKVVLDHIDGNGSDCLTNVLWNMLVMKKVNGDSFAQIIREKGLLVNIIPLSAEYVVIEFNKKGRIKKYIYNDPMGKVTFEPDEILHFCNDRVSGEVKGRSVIEAVEWNIDAQEEAKRAYRKMVKNNGVVRVIEIDTDDQNKLSTFKAQWKTAIENGDVLLIPKQVAEAKDWHGNLDTAGVLAWLQYLDNEFYISIGIPKTILGGALEGTEAGQKIAYLTYEPLYKSEITELKEDLWRQLGIKVEFGTQPSMMDNVQTDESKNQSQTGFQQNDVEAGAGK